MATNFTFVPQLQHSLDGRRRIRSRTACEACRNRKRRCNHQRQSRRDPDFQRPSKSPHASSPTSNDTTITARPAVDNGDHSPEVSETTGMNPAQEAIHVSSAVQTQLQQPAQRASPSAISPLLQQRPSEPQSRPQHQTPGQPPQLGQLPSQTAPDARNSPAVHLPSHVTDVSPQTFDASPSTPRFVSDLNPEARLLDNANSPEEAQNIAPDKVGVWIHNPRPCITNASNSSHRSRLSTHIPSVVSDLVCSESIAALSEIYFAKIHPLLPILNQDDYQQSFVSGTLPPALAHVVCLLAAKDASAEPHLKLLQAGGTSVLSARQFCSHLHASLVSSLASRVNIRQLTAIRIMALLSFHHEGCDGAEQASGYIAQAIHGAQSLALHLRVPVDDGFEMRRLFWCLWILDRLNAAMHSRPCIMCDHDIATETITPEQSGFPAFDILFNIAKILNKVIALYRPSQPESITGIGDEFPGFSQMMEEGRGLNLAPSIISTLQIFYLTTAVLGHRLKTIAKLPTSTEARMRQQLATVQIIRHMRDPVRLRTLHPFPIIVYAASLAVSVSYQQLRYSRLTTDQEQAQEDFSAACEILQVLRQKWESADVMASLAHRISVELNKVPSLDLLRVNRDNGLSAGQGEAGRSRVVSAQQQERQQQQPVTRQNQRSGVGGLVTPDNSQLQNITSPSQAGTAVTGPSMEMDGENNELPYTWDSETYRIFDGMDDMAWMYLDAENPVSFDLLPPVRDYSNSG